MSEKDLDYKQSRENLIRNIEYMDSSVLQNNFMTYGYDFRETLLPNGQTPLDFNVLDPLSKTSELALRYLLGHYLAQIPGSEYKKFHNALHHKFLATLIILKDPSLTDDAQAIRIAYEKLRHSLKLNELEPLGFDIFNANFVVPTLRVFEPTYSKTFIHENERIVELESKNAALQLQLEEQKKLAQQEREMKMLILKSQNSAEKPAEVDMTPKTPAPMPSKDEEEDFDMAALEHTASTKSKNEAKYYHHYLNRLVMCITRAETRIIDEETREEIISALAELEYVYKNSSSITEMMEIYGRLDDAIPEFERLVGIAPIEFPHFEEDDQTATLKDFNFNYDTDGETDEALQEGLEPLELTEQEKRKIEADVERDTKPAQKLLDTIKTRNQEAKVDSHSVESQDPDPEASVANLFAQTTFSGYSQDELDEHSLDHDESTTEEKSKIEAERAVPQSFLRRRSSSQQPASRRPSDSSDDDLLQEGFAPFIRGGQSFNYPPQHESARQGENPDFDSTPFRTPPDVNPPAAGNHDDPRARAAGPGIFQPAAQQPAPINDFYRDVIEVAQRAHLIHDPSQDNILHFHADNDPQKTVNFIGQLDNWQISGNDVQKIVDFAQEMKNRFPNTEIWIISQRRDDNDLVAIQKDLETLRALTVANVKIDMRDLEHLERLHANEYRQLAQAQEQLRQQEPHQSHGLGID